MSGAKYYVWGGGRWREVDLCGGVAGWARRARFVVARRGRLRVAPRRRVLDALRALAAGAPSAAALGPRLSALRHEPAETPTPRKEYKALPSVQPVFPPSAFDHHHCCMHYNRCNNIKQLPTCAHSDTRAVLSRCEVGTQHESLDHNQLTNNVTNKLADKAASPPFRRRAPPLDTLLDEHASPSKRPRSASANTDDSTPAHTKPNKAGRVEPRQQTDKEPEATDSSGEAACKELTISESDVSALRSFVARHRRSALARFDADDSYKRLLFYAINPLVDVARCPRTERALRERSALALPHFAARLGLAPHDRSAPVARSAPAARSARPARPVSYRESSSSTDADKENRRRTDTSDDTRSDRSDSDTFHRPRGKINGKSTPLRKNRVTSNTDDERDNLNLIKDKKSVTKYRANTRNSDSDNLMAIRDNKRENNKTVSRDKPNRDHSGSDRQRKSIENKRELNRNTSDRTRNVVKHKHEGDKYSDDKRETFRKTAEDKASSLRRKTMTPTKPNLLTGNDNIRENGANSHKTVVTKNRNSSLVMDSDSDDNIFIKKSVLRTKSYREHDNSSNSKRDTYRRFSYSQHNDGSRKKTVVNHKHKESTTSNDEHEELKASEHRLNSLRRKTITPTKPDDVLRREKNNKNNANKRSAITKSTLVLESSSEGSETFVKKPESSSRVQGRTGTLKLASNSDNDRLQPSAASESGATAHKKQSALTSTSSGASLAPGHLETHTISKRASGSRVKEYSNLEDHAIVAWVGAGGRARRVNGNLLWCELQEQYPRLTGTERSWHSLRNRYLRYILPALGALHLPPHTAARLRAAAATGETKRKRVAVTARRNSIFDKESGARGASARGPHRRAPSPQGARSPQRRSTSPPGARSGAHARGELQRDDAPTDEAVGESSKRRSLRHRVSDVAGPAGPAGPSGPASGPSGPAPGPSGPAPGPSGPARTRRLFNPKLVL